MAVLRHSESSQVLFDDDDGEDDDDTHYVHTLDDVWEEAIHWSGPRGVATYP